MREVGEEKIKSLISDIFIAEVKPATGCTEVGTIGFACSYALNAAVGNLNGKLETIKKKLTRRMPPE